MNREDAINRPYWWQRLCPRYGNWGGIGWSAGYWNNYPEFTDWNVPAIDSMDALFKRHDWYYQQDTENLQYGDRELCINLHNEKPKTMYGKFYRILAMTSFTLVYLFRKYKNYFCKNNTKI